MRVQSLSPGYRSRSRTDLPQSLSINGYHAGHLQEIVQSDRRTEMRGAAGGHDMAGTGSVVSHDFRRVFADENTAGVPDLLGPGPGILDHQGDVLRSILIHQVYRSFQVRNYHDAAPVL